MISYGGSAIVNRKRSFKSAKTHTISSQFPDFLFTLINYTSSWNNFTALMERFSSIDTQAKNSRFNPKPENHLDRAHRWV